MRIMKFSMLALCVLVSVSAIAGTNKCPENCTQRQLRKCLKRRLLRKCTVQQVKTQNSCVCCIKCKNEVLVIQKNREEKKYYKQKIRKLVQKIQATSKSSRLRDLLIEELLFYEIQKLSLNRKIKKNKAKQYIFSSQMKATKTPWKNGSLEDLYFVKKPFVYTNINNNNQDNGRQAKRKEKTTDLQPKKKAKHRKANNDTKIQSKIHRKDIKDDELEQSAKNHMKWITELQDKMPLNVKRACRNIKCRKDKGEFCQRNIQGLPACRCPTKFHCASQIRRDRRPRKVCARLSGLPKEQTFLSLCHMHVTLCTSDSKTLSIYKGRCKNQDQENEAYERLANKKCIRCMRRGWKSSSCKTWRDRCTRWSLHQN